jgi:hypothetical protein
MSDVGSFRTMNSTSSRQTDRGVEAGTLSMSKSEQMLECDLERAHTQLLGGQIPYPFEDWHLPALPDCSEVPLGASQIQEANDKPQRPRE